MNRILAALLALVVCNICSATIQESTSPSGEYTARAEVAGADVSPSFRFRVRLAFSDSRTKNVQTVYTGVSGREWAICWAEKDSLVLFTTDNSDESHPEVFKREGAEFKVRAPTSRELELGRAALLASFPPSNKPNKAQEPTR